MVDMDDQEKMSRPEKDTTMMLEVGTKKILVNFGDTRALWPGWVSRVFNLSSLSQQG